MKCLTGNLPLQPECSSTGRKSVCLTEATHPSLKKVQRWEKLETAAGISSSVPQRAVPKLHANGDPGLCSSQTSNIC